jgi:hypothetical protein
VQNHRGVKPRKLAPNFLPRATQQAGADEAPSGQPPSGFSAPTMRLESGQRESAGITPQKWARCLALHRARQHLQSPEARALTVQGIANGCGFRHMGRFSTYYRELFGEAPSFTLTNRNQRSAQKGIYAPWTN